MQFNQTLANSTHEWTNLKLIAQSLNSLGDLGAFVLPHLICNSMVDKNLEKRMT
jgi:hypothetical protein